LWPPVTTVVRSPETIEEAVVAIAFVQEFPIQDADTSTTNYDAVMKALDLKEAPEGLLIHTAGFDHDGGVFRILDVWETRADGERFVKERLNPIIEPMMEQATREGDESFAPPTRESWYELHDHLTG
jgi:hypothetical protein